MQVTVIDRWTTEDGSWEVRPNKRWGIDQGHRDEYHAGKFIPPAGADHHIIVSAPIGTKVEFVNVDSHRQVESATVGSDGWVNFPIFQDSGYNADAGAQGPWSVRINGVIAASGIGLPLGHHVSTFLVVHIDADEPAPPPVPTDPAPTNPPPTPTPGTDSVEVTMVVSGLVYQGRLYRTAQTQG
jgi:hypothetical protein